MRHCTRYGVTRIGGNAVRWYPAPVRWGLCLLWGLLVSNGCEPDKRLQEGRQLLAAGDYAEAARVLETAGADADRYLARAYLATGRFDEAVQSVERALGRTGDDPELQETLGIVLTARAYAHNEFRRTEAAEAAFRRALQLDPDRSHSYYNLGVIYTHRDSLDQALRAYLAALQIDSTLVQAHKKVGEIYRKAGNAEAAIHHYRRVTELAEDDAEAFYYQGLLLRDAGRRRQAVEALERAAALNPHSPQVLVSLGQAYIRLGKREEGRQALQRSQALRRQKRDLGSNVIPPAASGSVPVGPVKAHHNLGLHRAVRGDLKGAEREYRKAIAIDSTYVDAHTGLGVVLTSRGDFQGAVAALERAVALDPKDTVTRTRLGLALLKAGELDASRAALEGAARSGKPFPELAFTRGLLEASTGNLVAARAHFAEAVELRPHYRDALLNLGVTNMKTGRVQKAAQAYERLVELDAGDQRAHLYLSDALRQLGHHAASRQHRRTAARLQAMASPSTAASP